MKRINDEEMKEMLKQPGTTQRDVAKHFNVTEQAVCKRLKQLKSYKVPESFSRLTEKQKVFVLAKAEGKNSTEAAMTAFDCQDSTSAKAMGYKTSHDPDVTLAVRDLLHQEGIGRRKRIQQLKKVIECADLSVVCKGLDIANKLTGEYVAEKDKDGDAIRSIVNIITMVQEQVFAQEKKAEEREIENVIDVKPIN